MRRTLLALTALLGACGTALATNCQEHFYLNQPPALNYMPAGDLELCNDNFGELYDPERKTPVYSAERLTPQSLTAAVGMERANNFHADPRVPREDSATPADYRGGEYDRGHMAPDHDMPTQEAKVQSDSLANVVPQDPDSNRGIWDHIERTVRRMIVTAPEGYVVTGPIYDGAPKLLNARVAIPDRLFKAVYIPAGGTVTQPQVGVYVVRNAPESPVELWTLDQLKATTGLNAFPAVSPEDHTKVNLPPVAHK
jgi:endonuclease G